MCLVSELTKAMTESCCVFAQKIYIDGNSKESLRNSIIEFHPLVLR